MRSLAALALALVVACGSSTSPQPVDVPPAQTLDVPPIDAGAPPARTPVLVEEAPSTPPPDDNTPTAAGDEFDKARDPVFGKRTPRSRAIVVTELQGLSSLFAATPPGKSDRPNIQKRVADDYFELGHDPAGRPKDSYRSAIKEYSDLAQNSPKYAQRDEVYYYWGLACEQIADFATARRAYYELIKNYPQSKYIPYAYFAFGEMFRAEIPGDPSKADLARQAYQEVIKYSASPIRPFGQKRLNSLPRP